MVSGSTSRKRIVYDSFFFSNATDNFNQMEKVS
jgi:hypothetical protein